MTDKPLLDTILATLVIGGATLVLLGRGLISWLKYRRVRRAARAVDVLLVQMGSGSSRPTEDSSTARPGRSR